MTRRHVYRVHDRVRVVTPKVFLRCGYPYDIVKEGEKIQEQWAEEIVALLDKMDPQDKPTPVRHSKYSRQAMLASLVNEGIEEFPFVPVGLEGRASSDYRDLCSRFARIIAQRRGFGGSERRIHTEEQPELAGAELIVSGKSVCKTGDRYSGWRGYEGDYEPPGLANEQSHVILQCYSTDYTTLSSDHIRIEAANVEPITEETSSEQDTGAAWRDGN